MIMKCSLKIGLIVSEPQCLMLAREKLKSIPTSCDYDHAKTTLFGSVSPPPQKESALASERAFAIASTSTTAQ